METLDHIWKYVAAGFFQNRNAFYVLICFLCAIATFLKVAYQNDGEAALIQFASPDEAKRAIQSTEAVLNNRFIRVHWFRDDGNDGQGHSHSQLQPRTQPPRVIFFYFIYIAPVLHSI